MYFQLTPKITSSDHNLSWPQPLLATASGQRTFIQQDDCDIQQDDCENDDNEEIKSDNSLRL